MTTHAVDVFGNSEKKIIYQDQAWCELYRSHTEKTVKYYNKEAVLATNHQPKEQA